MKTATLRPPGSRTKSTAGAAAPTLPLPPPKLSYAQSFIRRLEQIFSGQNPTPENELFEPLEEAPVPEPEIVGKVTDTKARELFSLARSLQEQAHNLPVPRKSDQTAAWKRDREILAEQSDLASMLFWEYAKACVDPDTKIKHLSVGAGWILFVPRRSIIEDFIGGSGESE